MDTLGGAVAVAAELEPQAAAELVRASREAFLAGVRLCAAISAVGTLALVGFVLARFRDVRRPAHA
jgi:hypothetical protein